LFSFSFIQKIYVYRDDTYLCGTAMNTAHCYQGAVLNFCA
jgi:hypothetical protein